MVIVIANGEKPHPIVADADLLGLFLGGGTGVGVSIVFGATGLDGSPPGDQHLVLVVAGNARYGAIALGQGYGIETEERAGVPLGNLGGGGAGFEDAIAGDRPDKTSSGEHHAFLEHTPARESRVENVLERAITGIITSAVVVDHDCRVLSLQRLKDVLRRKYLICP